MIMVAVLELPKTTLVVVLFETYKFDLTFESYKYFKCYVVVMWVLELQLHKYFQF